jgi:hypothetical protein
MSTPGLVIDEAVLVSGRVPKLAEVREFLTSATPARGPRSVHRELTIASRDAGSSSCRRIKRGRNADHFSGYTPGLREGYIHGDGGESDF